jgi:hypothetical protein
MVERDDSDRGVASSTHRRRFLAALGALGVTGMAGCSGGDDETASPTGTPTPTAGDPTTATATTERSTLTPTPTATPDLESYYTVSGQQTWNNARGTTEGVQIEGGVLSTAPGSDAGRFESIEFTGGRSRTLRLRVHETPLWDSWSYRGRLREFTGGQARGTNDTVMFVDMDREYPYTLSTLDVGTDPVGHYWWRSRDFESWEQVCVYDDHPTDEWGAGTNYQFGRVAPDGSYRIYGSYNDDVTDLWTGPDICSLERVGEVHPNPDCGGFYEPDTGTWHLYYETEGEIPYEGGPTANALGHSTSPTGTGGDWEDHGKIVDLSDVPEHTGDPEVIQVGDTYFMFIDWTANHPDYRQAVMTSPDLHEWTLQGQVTFEMGGDFTVRYIPDRGEFVALAEFAPGGGVSVFTSPGPVSNALSVTLRLDSTGDGSYDTTVEASRDVEYDIGADMSQVTTTGSPTAHTWTADFDVEIPAGRAYRVTINLGHPGTRIDGFELVDAG